MCSRCKDLSEKELAYPVVLMFCLLNSLLGEKQSDVIVLVETGVIPGVNPSENFEHGLFFHVQPSP